MNHMITIRKNSELQGAEKYGCCVNCSKGSSEVELYRICFTHNNFINGNSIDLCMECMKELKTMLEEILNEENF